MSNIKQQLVKVIARAGLVASLLPGAAMAQAPVVSISTGEWPPFTSESLPDLGIGPHIVTAAFSKVGIDAKYVFFPWSRAMKESEEGRVDFSALWFFTEERAETFAYTDDIISSGNVFFYRKDRPMDWSSFEQFPEDIVIGVTREYSYGEDFDLAAQAGKVKTEIANSDVLNFRKLLRGRIDGFAIGELVGYDILRNQFSDREAAQLTAHPTKISDAPLHLITGKSNDSGLRLIELFNRGLKELRDSGEYGRIIEGYQ